MVEGIRLARIKIQTEPLMMYYVKADEEGWLCIYKTPMVQGRKKKEVHSKKLAILEDKEEGEALLEDEAVFKEDL